MQEAQTGQGRPMNTAPRPKGSFSALSLQVSAVENDEARGFEYEDDAPPPPEPPRPPMELFEAETDLKAAPKRRLAAPKAEEDDDWGNDDLGDVLPPM